MERNLCEEAIVIGTRRTGEINRELTLLSPVLGVVRVTVYGGRKSRKALTPPLFSYGKFYLFYNPSTGRYNLQDADFNFFDYDLDQIGIASFVAELSRILGEPDPGKTYALAKDALVALKNAKDQVSRSEVFIQFVFRMMKIAGLVADLDKCPSCLKPYGPKEFAFYNRSLNFFCCENCSDDKSLFIGPGARKYLAVTGSKTFAQALEVPLLENTALRLRKLMTNWAMNVCGFKLKTVQSNMV